MHTTMTLADMAIVLLLGLASIAVYAYFPRIVRTAYDTWSSRSRRATQRNIERLTQQLRLFQALASNEDQLRRHLVAQLARLIFSAFACLLSLALVTALPILALFKYTIPDRVQATVTPPLPAGILIPAIQFATSASCLFTLILLLITRYRLNAVILDANPPMRTALLLARISSATARLNAPKSPT